MFAIQLVRAARLEEEVALRGRKARKMKGADQARGVSTWMREVGMRPWSGRGLGAEDGQPWEAAGAQKGAAEAQVFLRAGACPGTGDGAKRLSP